MSDTRPPARPGHADDVPPPTASSGRPATPRRASQPPATPPRRAVPSAAAPRRAATPDVTGAAARPAVRGVTAGGVLMLGLVLAVAGALTDAVVRNTAGLLFAAVWAVGALWGALRVRRADRLAGVIVPPLTYAVGLAVAAPVLGGGGVLVQGAELLNDLATAAPVLVPVTLLCGLIVWRRRY